MIKQFLLGIVSCGTGSAIGYWIYISNRTTNKEEEEGGTAILSLTGDRRNIKPETIE